MSVNVRVSPRTVVLRDGGYYCSARINQYADPDFIRRLVAMMTLSLQQRVRGSV